VFGWTGSRRHRYPAPWACGCCRPATCPISRCCRRAMPARPTFVSARVSSWAFCIGG
jgi:hypothetical protein